MAIVLTLTFLVSGTTVYAQQTSGALYGKVAAGTAVTAENVDTGFKRSVTASSDGSYRIGSLPPGPYKVTYNDGSLSQTKDVDVAIGSSTLVGSGDVLELEKFVVGGLSVNPVDFSSTESVSVFNEKQIDLLPIARNPSSIALLAPGTTLGDTAFGNLVSFGGASVAENAYFVNGFNISNFRNGLDPATVPFEFYSQFEVKTGAYSAEFGRSTGGVISASTKSGSNEYHAGANVYFQPSGSYETSPDSYYKDATGANKLLVYNSADEREQLTSNVYASGPLWKNKIFFYGLYQTRDIKQQDVLSAGTQHLTQESDDPFWGAKLDVVPFENHRLEFTAFRDKSRLTGTQYDYDLGTHSIVPGSEPSIQYTDRGGTTKIGRYTGTFFEKLTISALYGKSTQNLTDQGSLDVDPYILDGRSGTLNYVGGNPNGTISVAQDEREAMRFDAEYAFSLAGTHRLRAGFDREDNLSDDQTIYSGGHYYRYFNIPSSGMVNGVAVPAGPNAGYVRDRIYRNGGSFQVKSDAWYVEDNWSLLNDRLNLRLGLRSESFENLDSAGGSFIKIDGQKAPRIGASYDLFGNKTTKVYANFGRYHLPVASNTNVRLAGGEFFTADYYVLNSVNGDGTPSIGAKLGGTEILSDGSVHDRREIVDMDISPMYQDEWVLGVQHAINKNLLMGVRFTTREISGTAMDDMLVDGALQTWARANGFPTYTFSGAHAYVLANPGRPIHMFWDFNENGTLDATEDAHLTPEQLGYPTAVRKYNAVEFTLEKVWDGKWNAQFSYTWSQSYGNYEGWVLSDNGQDDAGITQLFDTPDLTRNTYGKLPNDRRHQFKAFGSYAVTPEFSMGLNMLISSGRPINEIVPYNDAILGTAYGVSYLGVPRGSAGTTSWQFRTDLSLVYRPKWVKERLTLSLDIFNLLNGHAATEVFESKLDDGFDPDYRWGAPTSWQAPRYLRLSANFEY